MSGQRQEEEEELGGVPRSAGFVTREDVNQVEGGSGGRKCGPERRGEEWAGAEDGARMGVEG